MNKTGFLLTATILLLCGCGNGPTREVSTPKNALVGRWRDKRLWGWEYHFNRDGSYRITVNSAPSYEGQYEVLDEAPADRKIAFSLVGTGQSKGTDLAAKGAFSQDYRTLTGNKEDIIDGKIVTEKPQPFFWRYVGPR